MDRVQMIEELSKIVGKENVLSSETDLLLYGYDASLFKGKPDCIAFPGSTPRSLKSSSSAAVRPFLSLREVQEQI